MSLRTRAGWMITCVACLFASLSTFSTWRAFAAGGQPPGPDRFAVVTRDYTNYVWWLTDWGNNQVACSLNVDHDGVPTYGEVFSICGKPLYDKWIATQSCPPDGTCSGLYLQLIKTMPAQKQVAASMPPPVVWVSLDGCIPYNSTLKCNALPTLVLTGEEPMAGEHITGLAGRMDGRTFTCDAICQVDMAPTSNNGMLLEFWANSSYGDSSILFEARVRVAASGDPADHSWYVDVLSSQWRGAPLAGCSQIWDSFPPVRGLPGWLSTPTRATDLATNISYEYLAANMIRNGAVDGSVCSDGGLLDGGMASQCGINVARYAVTDWQNSFDDIIFITAQHTGVPARLLKSIFSRESQFWPGGSTDHTEAGLGQMTSGGADTTLLWNQPFFEQFCPSMLDGAVCDRGYAQLSSEQQDTLRSALVSSVDASCPDCDLGIDQERTKNSVGVFANTLLANCEQAGMIVHNTYGAAAGASASFEDLWRFSLVNYHSGPGCLTLAIWETKRLSEPLDWSHLSSHFTPVCQGALDYVNYISAASP